MLTTEQKATIARTTRYNWNGFSHEDYFGYELVKDYIADFDYMKEVLTKKHLKQAMKFACSISYGYSGIISEIEKNKKLVRKHAENISFSINRIARYGKMKKKDACKLFGVSRDWFYRHRKKKPCLISKIGKCFRQFPNQMTIKELSKIEKIVQLPESIGKTMTTLYYDSMRKGLFFCGRTTFFKYAKSFGYVKIKKPKSKHKKPGFKATRVFEWLHVDITDVKTEMDGIQKVAFVKDNYSKALLHYKSIPKNAGSQFICELFEETFAKYGLLNTTLPINILSDGGSENRGSLLEWINQIIAPPIVTKITANTPEFPFSNSMSESTHSIYKTEFMKTKHSYDITQHLKNLDRFMIYYNDERFPTDHFGLNPSEVLNGRTPNKFKFRTKKKNAKVKRIKQNQEFNQCPLVCFSI